MERVHIPFEQLIAYTNKELSESESAIVAAHTATCTECNSTVRHFRSIRNLLRTDFMYDPPAATVARAQMIYREHRAKPRSCPQQRINWSEFFQVKLRPAVSIGLAALLLTFILVLSQATVAAANEAIPGDTLYPIKISIERLQLAVAMDNQSKAEALLMIAQHRIHEIVKLNATGRDNHITPTVTAYEKATRQATNAIENLAQEDASRAAALSAKANDDLSKNIAVLTALLEKVPEQSRSVIAHAISESKKDKATIQEKTKSDDKEKTPTQTPSTSPGVLPTATRVMPIEPPGLQRTPGPPAIPPGKFVTPGVPPGRDATTGPPGQPPGQAKTPGPPEAPPGQERKTAEPTKIPPGQEKKTAEPSKVPPGQEKNK